jgi:outer membrane receptor for ferrienterochelin and colicins
MSVDWRNDHNCASGRDRSHDANSSHEVDHEKHLSRRLAQLAALTCALTAASAGAQTVQRASDNDDGNRLDSIVVTATRSGQLVRDQPLRVEVVPDVEIEESLTVAPGNLTNLLNELAGARMQPSAPGLGGTALQLRGLPGRHAQILSDGLPLGGAQTDSFSLMQTAPLDLARVEVIKGVASALYGGSALAGVLNLVSQPPDGEADVLLNQTSVGGSDAVGFIGDSLSPSLGYTLIGSGNYQSREDPDHDGWSDLPGYKRASLRPRLFWHEGEDRTVFATLGLMQEDRTGGTMPGRELPTGGTFAEALHTRRIDGGMVAHTPVSDARRVSARWSANLTEYDRVYGTTRVEDEKVSVFGEATLQGELRAHKWIVGAALQYERLHTSDVPGVSFDYTVPAVFAQDEFALASWLSIAASARVDAHSDYGTFVSPRVSALFRTGEDWSLRASIGTGFAAPTPLIEEVQARSLALLNPVRGLRAERASSMSIDAKWAEKPWDVNVSVFSSEIRHPLDVEPAAQANRLELVNGEGTLRARGAEVLVGYSTDSLHVLANSTYLDVTEAAPLGGRRDAELIPRFSAELAVILEDEERGRIGMEIAYTGHQALSDNPFRTVSRAYVEVNALAEVKAGRAAFFVNAMNLTNVRQRDEDPLLRPTPGLGGEPITDVWAPLIGRTFNLGVRLEL